MTVTYHPEAPRGRQWSVAHDGRMIANVSRIDAAAALRSQGRSINEASIELAKAKLQVSRA
ncbi:hypothetical protein [Lacipirellula parvula]|uniref:hypothetical protein n=1 Tax=Lacipirellula parvula TaxID=2650471 RepID=UPI00126134DB|nr:hypothetical protein [Lacipirellula parvula]